MKKAVIFDLNGVFIVSPKLSDRFRDSFGVQSEDFLPALNEIMGIVRKPGAGPIYSYWQPYFQEWGVNLSESEFLSFWFSAEKENTEMVSLARELKTQGVRLFICSNNFRERAAYYTEHFPFLKELFEKVYYSWQTGHVKPDAQGYETIVREHDLVPQDCVYFDDSEKNVGVARELGIESHLFKGVDATRRSVRGEDMLEVSREQRRPIR